MPPEEAVLDEIPLGFHQDVFDLRGIAHKQRRPTAKAQGDNVAVTALRNPARTRERLCEVAVGGRSPASSAGQVVPVLLWSSLLLSVTNRFGESSRLVLNLNDLSSNLRCFDPPVGRDHELEQSKGK